jgi:hypothetical protein
MTYPSHLRAGDRRPGVAGVWRHHCPEPQPPRHLGLTTPRPYAELDGGIRILGANSASFQLSGGYAGLFVPYFHAWNVTAHLTILVQ